jgi:hypothetical protein
MAGESGNGNGVGQLWAVVLTVWALWANAFLWGLNRLQGMDEARQQTALLVEQRMTRLETKLDLLLARGNLAAAPAAARRAGRLPARSGPPRPSGVRRAVPRGADRP